MSLDYLDYAAKTFVTFSLPVRYEFINRFKHDGRGSDSEDAGAKFCLRAQMVEERRRLFVALRGHELCAHHKEDIDIIRIGLGGHIAAEYDETFESTCPLRKFTDSLECGGHNLTLPCAVAKALNDFFEGGSVDTCGQIAITIALRKRHSFPSVCAYMRRNT